MLVSLPHTQYVRLVEDVFSLYTHTLLSASFILPFLILHLLTNLFPVSSNLMTEWFWPSSSFSTITGGLFWMEASLLCLLLIWGVCVCVCLQELLAAVFTWLWGQYAHGFADKKNTPQLNVLDWEGRRGFEAQEFSAWGDILQYVGWQFCSWAIKTEYS